jgi:hypothetical protein
MRERQGWAVNISGVKAGQASSARQAPRMKSKVAIDREEPIPVASRHLQYADGQELKLGDHVRVGEDDGIVVASLDTGEFSDPLGKTQWRFLKTGVLVMLPDHGLVHCKELGPDIKLIQRLRQRRVASSST